MSLAPELMEILVCPQCKGDQMIPADSPIGRKIIADLAPK